MKLFFALVLTSVSAIAYAATNDFYVGSSYTADETHFNTVQAAFDAVPEESSDAYVIHLAAGEYAESVVVGGKQHNILLLGNERNPGSCQIVGNTTQYADGDALRLTGAMANFETRGVTFINALWKAWRDAGFPDGGHPGIKNAVFIGSLATPVVFRHCRILAGQDTLYINGAAGYFEDCYIEGDTDFIYGAKTALFNRCEIFSRGGHITAGAHPAGTYIGYLFWKCRFLVAPGKETDLGRSWRSGANVWLADCYLGKGIATGMWGYWNDVKGETVLRDYGTRSETRFTPPNLKGQWGEGIIVRGTMAEFWQEMTRFGFDSIDDIFSQDSGDWRPVMRNGIEIREAP